MATTEEAATPIVVSPVPGINPELATSLITAIKSRRKHLSKSSSRNEKQERLQSLKQNADDATSSFIHQLRKQVEGFSKPSGKQRRSTNAAVHSLEFLLSTLSEAENSFHLRRAALMISSEILERSSDARVYLNSGGVLMEFVSMIRRVENDNDEETGAGGTNSLSPRTLFQQDAIELIKYLADKFGTFYPKFIVASRLMGEISVISSDSINEQGQRKNMASLRMERDIALNRGDKACDVLERIIERADGYFRVLVPRYGGFMYEASGEGLQDMEANAETRTEHADGESGLGNHNMNKAASENGQDLNGAEEDDSDDSIIWEEGDADITEGDETSSGHLPISHEVDSHTSQHDQQTEPSSTADHHTAVSQTLAVMERSGLLQEGGLSLQLGTSVHNTTLISNTNDGVRIKLNKLVQDLSTRRLPRLNKWIHALSHADGMEVRSVADPASNIAGAGPVSLVLLPEAKRVLRGSLLKRMLKIKSEIESVLQSASALDEDRQQADAKIESDSADVSKPNPIRERKRVWLSSVVVAGKPVVTKKKPKSSKFKVIYRKK